jgi:GntR family transcriptional regulator
MADTYIPIYLKIAQALEEEIQSGKYKAGDLLPTEKELESLFKVSRTTIRSAIGMLERHGYLSRKQGSGTIVRQTRMAQMLNYITSLTETFENKGMKVSTGTLSINRIVPPEKVRSALSLDENEQTYMVQRTRIVNDEIIAFVTNYVPSRIVHDLENQYEKLKHCGLYQLLEREYGIVLKNAVETISVYLSGPIETDIFHIQEKTPLFHSDRVTWLDDETPFELGTSIIRADRYEFTVYLSGRPPVGGETFGRRKEVNRREGKLAATEGEILEGGEGGS